MRKSYSLLFHLLLLIVFKTHSQNSIKGSITNESTGKPVPFCTVYIHTINKGTSTDTNGNYLINNLPDGKFLTEVKSIGYTTKTIELEIKGHTIKNFILKEAVAEIDPVIITGVPSPTIARNSPIPILRINKDALLQNSSTNIIDAISNQPGVAQVSTGAAISKPVIRGLSYNRVISLYNGIRQEGQQWGDEHGIEIDEYSIDKVEIVKGPGSLLYGSDGIGGVLNFLSPKPLQEGEIKGNFLANYQTNNNLIGYSLMNSGNIKKMEWLLRCSSKHAGNYSNANDGKVFNSGFKEFDYNGYVGTTRKWGNAQLHFTGFNQKIAMPEGERDSLGNFTSSVPLNDSTVQDVTISKQQLKGYKINLPYQYIRHSRIYLTNNILFSKSSVRFSLGYQLNRRQEFGDILKPEQYSLYFYLPTINYDLKYFLPEFKGWNTTIGFGGMYQRNQNRGIEFLIPDYSLFDIGFFCLIKKKVDKLNISGGLRVDERKISGQSLYLDNQGLPTSQSSAYIQKFSSFNNSYLNYSGSIGATYDITEKLSAKANLSRGFRAPNIAELASNGKHEGTFRYEYGNTGLKAETSFQADAGINFISEHINAELNIFNNNISNYIYSVKLQSKSGHDSIADPTDPVPVYQYGQNNSILSGGEFAIDLHPHPFDWLHFENSISIVQGKIKNQSDSAKYLPFMPAPRYKSKLRANIKNEDGLISNFYLQFEVDHSFKQNHFLIENKTETFTSAYTLINAGTGSDFKNKEGKILFTIYISANNILNTAYQNHLSRLKYAPVNFYNGKTGIFNMGRNLSFKILFPINFKG